MIEYINIYNEFWLKYGIYCYQTMLGGFNNFAEPTVKSNKISEISNQELLNKWQTGELTL